MMYLKIRLLWQILTDEKLSPYKNSMYLIRFFLSAKFDPKHFIPPTVRGFSPESVDLRVPNLIQTEYIRKLKQNSTKV